MAKPTNPTLLQERVLARLAELRRSPRDVSLRAGLGPDAIRTIISGRSRSPRADTLAALADELQCDVSYLLGQSEKPYTSEALRRNKEGTVRGVDKLQIRGRLSNEWKPLAKADGPEDPFDLSGDFVAVSNVHSLPNYLTGYQELHYMDDDHAAPVIPRGAYLHTFSLGGTAKSEIRDDDLVVVERQAVAADGSGLIQRSCRIFRRVSSTEALLELPNSSLREPPVRLLGSLFRATHGDIAIAGRESVYITALVLRSIVELAGPSVFSGIEPHPDPARIPNEP